jgi:hypothetical protein
MKAGASGVAVGMSSMQCEGQCKVSRIVDVSYVRLGAERGP